MTSRILVGHSYTSSGALVVYLSGYPRNIGFSTNTNSIIMATSSKISIYVCITSSSNTAIRFIRIPELPYWATVIGYWTVADAAAK